MKEIQVKIKGTVGLIQNRFPQAVAKALMNPVKLSSRAKLSPEEDAELAAYRMTDGTLCQPSEHIYQSMIKTATAFQVVGRGKKTYKDAVKGGMVLEPEFLPHKSNEYEILSVPVVIQRARVMKHRPLISDWELEFKMVILDEESFPSEVAKAILQRAGEQTGIGDWRPRYGRYQITEWKE